MILEVFGGGIHAWSGVLIGCLIAKLWAPEISKTGPKRPSDEHPKINFLRFRPKSHSLGALNRKSFPESLHPLAPIVSAYRVPKDVRGPIGLTHKCP